MPRRLEAMEARNGSTSAFRAVIGGWKHRKASPLPTREEELSIIRPVAVAVVRGRAAPPPVASCNHHRSTSKRKRECAEKGCSKLEIRPGNGKCKAHGGGRRCSVSECDTAARSKSVFCRSHGGAARCAEDGCTKPVGNLRGTRYCSAHGGKKLCKIEGCSNCARTNGPGDVCAKHGGGRRCDEDGCSKLARSAENPRCVEHGGGPRCQHARGCERSAVKYGLCVAHGAHLQARARAQAQAVTHR